MTKKYIIVKNIKSWQNWRKKNLIVTKHKIKLNFNFETQKLWHYSNCNYAESKKKLKLWQNIQIVTNFKLWRKNPAYCGKTQIVKNLNCDKIHIVTIFKARRKRLDRWRLTCSFNHYSIWRTAPGFAGSAN